ncbi:hypothetical protein J9303_07280 [Bacillaceae bacterium Marseille-Q3522]|nr:hypothetical protein [Bacillaceae bacterium Marseille-Q3522]
MNKISEELQFYFETVGEFNENGEYVIKNEQLLRKRIEEGDSNAYKLYELSKLKYESSYGTNGAYEFGKCVVNKFIGSYGNIARQFLNGWIFIYIKNKQYDLAARLMFDVLKKAGFKVNVVGIAIEAGIYGWQCRNRW